MNTIFSRGNHEVTDRSLLYQGLVLLLCSYVTTDTSEIPGPWDRTILDVAREGN